MTHRDDGDDDDAEYTPTVQTPPHALPAHPTALPENEPHALPVAEKRGDLVTQIDELEGALQYMGSLHPRRDELRQRLSGLRQLLERWDETVRLQQR